MKRLFIPAIISAVMLAIPACDGGDSQDQGLLFDENIQPEEKVSDTEAEALVDVSFVADVQSGTSKATLANGGYAFSASEFISVFPGSNTGKMYKFGSQCDANATSAVFSGLMGDGESKSEIFYSVLPYKSNCSCSDGKIKLTLPNTQSAIANTFDPESGIMVSTATTKNGTYKFKPVCSFLKLVVEQEVWSLTIQGGDGEILAGEVSVDPATGESTVINGQTSITLKPSGQNTKIAKGTYYISMLPTTIKNKLIIKKEDDVVLNIVPVTNLAFLRSHSRTFSTVKNQYNEPDKDGKVITITIPDTDIKIEMVYISGGVFYQGGRLVTLSPYYIGKYEVTREQYVAIMEKYEDWKTSKLPADDLSWDEANAYISALNILTGRNFHLPTEAQWEFAAKENPDDVLDEMAWYSNNAEGHTHEVGGKKPNKYGIYDMLGNVWEWCYDWYGDYPSEAQIDPSGPDGGYIRVLRGGSWNYGAGNASSSARYYYYHSYGSFYGGFRLALFL